jgi:hypothetical protein
MVEHASAGPATANDGDHSHRCEGKSTPRPRERGKLQENPLAPPIGRFPPELKKAADPASVPPFDPNLFQLDAAPQQGVAEKGAIVLDPIGWNVSAPEQCDHALHWIPETLSSNVRASFMILACLTAQERPRKTDRIFQ